MDKIAKLVLFVIKPDPISLANHRTSKANEIPTINLVPVDSVGTSNSKNVVDRAHEFRSIKLTVITNEITRKSYV